MDRRRFVATTAELAALAAAGAARRAPVGPVEFRHLRPHHRPGSHRFHVAVIGAALLAGGPLHLRSAG
jgi:hypothetical protein